MNHEPPISAPDPKSISAGSHGWHATDSGFRRGMTWIAVFGNAILCTGFFAWLMYQTIWGAAEPSGWLAAIIKSH